MLKGSILQKLNQAHSSDKKPLNLGVYYKNTLVVLCHALEDFILQSQSSPLIVTAFQRGKWYLQEADRYGNLAQKADWIAIMAAPDSGFDTHPTSQKNNVDLVHLQPGDPVEQEWHLIILSPTYTAMVLCQELSEADYGENKPQEDLERKFYGFWTFEPILVRETINLAIDHINNYRPELARMLAAKAEAVNAQFNARRRDDIDAVVSLVVRYLQASQKNLHQPETQADIDMFEALDRNIVSNGMQAFLRMAQLLDRTDVSNPMAASEVTAMAEAMAQLLDLPAWQAKRLYLAGLLHRVGLPKLTKTHKQSSAQQKILQQKDALPNASVLRVMPQLEAISKILLYQRESWDGSGIPTGLAYDDIPLESRIIGLLTDFQQKMKAYKRYAPDKDPYIQALSDCQALAGKRYDPKLVEALGLLVMGLQQGMSLQAYQPKISGGMWLIDSEKMPETQIQST
ncbi:DICT sensory domain-containing protein [Myxosarcina sp. GI1(2024)]